MTRSTKAQDYDFGPYEDEYRGFDIRDDDSGRGPLILVLALGVLLIFAGVVWNTYRQGVRPAEGGLPIIVGDEGPYKRAPDERGGLQVADQQKGFYAPMDGMGDPAVQKTSVRNPVDIRRGNNSVLAGGPETALPPVEGASEQVDVAEAGTVATEPDATKPLTIAAMQPVTKAAPPAVETQPVVQPLPNPIASSRFSANGGFQVQLSALRSEEAAQSAWSKLQGTAPDLYRGAALDIQRADLGAKGVFFRLRVGTFDSRDAAKGFCADVKATGKDCMVVAKAVG
jgi:cell division septation protein DedD